MAIKGASSYGYFCYNQDAPVTIQSRKRKNDGGTVIGNGVNFGLRQSSDGKKTRLIIAGTGNESDVYTLERHEVNTLLNNSERYRTGHVPGSWHGRETNAIVRR